MKPSIFIASSTESINVAYAVQKNLLHDAEVTIWSQGVFNPTNYVLEDLLDAVEKADYGIFIFSADDEVIMRKEINRTIRDNVLFEMGLFIGKIGRKRVFSLKPNNIVLHIASDLIGINILNYENDRQDKNIEAGTGGACNDIRNVIKRNGVIERSIEPQESPNLEEAEKEHVQKENLEAELMEYYKNNEYGKCVEIFDRLILNEENKTKKLNLQIGRALIIFKTDPTEGESQFAKIESQFEDDKKHVIVEQVANVFFREEYYKKCITYIENSSAYSEELVIIKAKCLSKIGKYEEALNILQGTICKEDSAKLRLQHYEIIDENQLDANNSEKHKLLREIYISYPNDERILFKYAYFAHYTLMNYNIALYLWKKLSDQHPKNYDYCTHLGNVYNSLKLYNSAIKSYDKANELANENTGWILSNIGNLYNNCGLHFIGRKYLEKALNLNANDDYVLKRLADAAEADKKESSEIQKYLKLAHNDIFANVE